MPQRLPLPIIVVDDEPDGADAIQRAVSSPSLWRQVRVSIDGDVIFFEPRVTVVTRSSANGAEFIDSVTSTVLGRASTACDPKYIPANIILVDWKFDSLNFERDAPITNGEALIAEIKKYKPNSFCALITAHSPPASTAEERRFLDFVTEKSRIRKELGQREFAVRLQDYINGLISSPYWEAIQEYTASKKIVMHAMALSDGESVIDSPSTSSFVKHFGTGMFFTEASLTLEPLDSLLAPSGALLASEKAFAKAFGAERARFVTNGTTTANQILHSALFDRTQTILVDRNCHISHHFGLARSGATPIYLMPEKNGWSDEFSQVSLTTIIDALESLIVAGPDKMPAGIVLTNCSFDGYVLSALEYVQSIRGWYESHELLDKFYDTVFIFDEAWFSFACFDPRLIQNTAMFARRALAVGPRRPRIYATQSLHKTLTAFRQASVILIGDPRFSDDRVHSRFDQAYKSFTTTRVPALQSSAHVTLLSDRCSLRAPN